MNGPILRILDANANRAREALRVIEDYARFVLDDAGLCSALKQLRHDLAAATAAFVPQAILHRDTPGDVGTATKTASELKRDDLAHVVTAAGKRLTEALRCLEEFAKVGGEEGGDKGTRGQGDKETGEAPEAARLLEGIRYRFYDIEQTIAFTLRPAGCAGGRFEQVRLYVLITQSLCRRPWLETAEQAILGGADCLQLREKDLESGELLARARQLVELCRRHRVISIINDRLDIALLADADGVHVGQTDLPARDVRRVLGRDKIVGVSTHCLEHARQAVLDGADYIGVGPIFRSTTKTRDFLPGAAYARQVAESIRIPAVAIAGITEANVDEVVASGLKAVAVTAAVVSAEDPRAAAQRLKSKLVG